MIVVDYAMTQQCIADIRRALAAFEAFTGERVAAIDIIAEPQQQLHEAKPKMLRRIELRLVELPTYLPFEA